LRGAAGIQDRTVLQLISTAGVSNPVIMPVKHTAPGLLNSRLSGGGALGRDANGVVRNEDGALNDAIIQRREAPP